MQGRVKIFQSFTFAGPLNFHQFIWKSPLPLLISDNSLMLAIFLEYIIIHYHYQTSGITSPYDIRNLLKIYVEKEMFGKQPGHKPSFLNRQFYPSIKCISSHIYKTSYQLKLRKLNQVNLQDKIKEWTKEDEERKFFLRMFKKKPEQTIPSSDCKEQLLYVHQEKWQRDLLLKYGNEICLLDATYKTTKYAVPLFFWCVKTNSGYSVVGKNILMKLCWYI